jgi:tRNA (guanine-N7-)-methyltransferase
MAPQRPALRTYGRLKARPIRARRAARTAARLPQLSVPDAPFDPRALAPGASEVWLEAGFGAGEHLAAQAQRRPDVLILGAEPFLNGLAACVAHIDALALDNVRLHPGDVRELMARLPDASLTRIFVLFPDPWPKTRHKKRRLLDAAFVAEAARLLAPGGRLRFATDWADYADWTLERLRASPSFRWVARRADDWRTPPADHVTTRYEMKRLGDCAPVWLEFERG